MKNKVLFFVLFVASTLSICSLSINIRSFDHNDFTRIVFEGDQGFAYKFNPSENAIKIKLNQKAKIENNINVFNSVLVDRVVHHWEENSSVFQVHMKSDFKIMRNFVLEQPFRVVFDLTESPGKKADKKSNIAPREIKEEEPRQEQEEKREEQPPVEPGKKKAYDLIRTICLDPGHGGSDLGAVGRSNLMEKDLTLKVAKKLKVLVESKLGLHVVMTRESDEEVSLNSRVAKANNQKAQMFISIHVNSSYRKAARGPETYYVSLKATDQDAFLLSQKENSAFKEEIDKLASDDELKMILWDMAQNEYIKASAKLADFIQYELNILMHTRNRGVKQAPFRVLMRAAMPAILVEIAFVSNYGEEKKLKDDVFLGKVAAALYTGISKYIYYHNNLYK
jgi:N-acetylmuramoyl-L-alanine amidase